MFMKDSFIKRRCDKHFLKRWVQGLGSTWTLTKSSLCGTCAGDKYKYKYKCAMWTISSEGDEWIPIISTQDVNKIILKIRAGLGSIEELTLVRPFHSRGPGHLQLQVFRCHWLVLLNDIIDQFNAIIDQARSILLLLAWLRLWHYSTADPGFSRLIKPFFWSSEIKIHEIPVTWRLYWREKG